MAKSTVVTGESNPANFGLKGYIPEIYSPKLREKFWYNTILRKITNTEFQGQFKNKGDTIKVRCMPNMTTKPFNAKTEMVYDDHITMGAHTAHAPLADQVSIRDRPVSNTAFTRILKYGGAGPTPPPTPGGGTGNFSQSTSSENTGKGVLKVTSKEIIKAFQSILKANGYYKGQIDGLMGPLTREALRKAGVK